MQELAVGFIPLTMATDARFWCIYDVDVRSRGGAIDTNNGTAWARHRGTHVCAVSRTAGHGLLYMCTRCTQGLVRKRSGV